MKPHSPAMENFFNNLKEVGTLISISKLNALTSKERRINECLSRSSMLLLCSHVESFFEDLIVDTIDFHERNQTLVSILPVKLKSIQTLRKPILDSLSAEKKWNIIQDISQSSFVDDTQVCKQGMFNAELHLKGFASPGSEAVENLFDGIGISKIWDLVEQKDSSVNLKRSLNVFISRRNGITHGASSDKPTIEDVKIYVCDVCEIVRTFNLIVTKYLIDNFDNNDPWGIITGAV
jgi:RiboL-PSP-HEPN